MANTCSTTELEKIVQAFNNERLTLTQDGAWAVAGGVFIHSDEGDVPGAAVIRSSVSDLMLWRKIGIAERPTVELAVKWLKTLPSGEALASDDARRLRVLLPRHPERFWTECAHWINLAGEWTTVDNLSYALTMQPLIPWTHLHQWVKQKTADLRSLEQVAINQPPFSGLRLLAQHVEDRLQSVFLTVQPERKEWLTTVGAELQRVELESDEETHRVRAAARELAETSWQPAPGVETIPYIDGQPAGTPRRIDVLWLNQALYVDRLPVARLAKRVPEELNKAFGRSDVKAALDYSFDRPAEHVRDYLEENFHLCELVDSHDAGPEGAASPGVDPRTIRTTETAPIAPEPAAAPEPPAAEPVDAEVMTPEDLASAVEPSNDTENPTPEPLSAGGSEPPNPPKPPMIERFALSQGFRNQENDGFLHPDGSWIRRSTGDVFPWKRWIASGGRTLSYWSKDHCLEARPLELPAEVWWMIEKDPETHALILADRGGAPIEVKGVQILERKAQERLHLHPATYRLEHRNADRP